MHEYRVKFIKAEGSSSRQFKADSVNGFQPEYDTYVFRTCGGEVVAAVPKSVVAFIEQVGAGA